MGTLEMQFPKYFGSIYLRMPMDLWRSGDITQTVLGKILADIQKKSLKYVFPTWNEWDNLGISSRRISLYWYEPWNSMIRRSFQPLKTCARGWPCTLISMEQSCLQFQCLRSHPILRQPQANRNQDGTGCSPWFPGSWASSSHLSGEWIAALYPTFPCFSFLLFLTSWCCWISLICKPTWGIATGKGKQPCRRTTFKNCLLISNQPEALGKVASEHWGEPQEASWGCSQGWCEVAEPQNYI